LVVALDQQRLSSDRSDNGELLNICSAGVAAHNSVASFKTANAYLGTETNFWIFRSE